MDKKIVEMIKGRYSLNDCNPGAAGIFKVKGMKFVTTHYEAEGLGSVSVMKASGMLGLMKMTTLIINPFSVDAPLISYDHICVAGKNILYMEMFNTMLGENFDTSSLDAIEKKYSSIADHALGIHWYDYMRVGNPVCKEGKKDARQQMDAMCMEYFEAYVDALTKAPACDESAKRQKASEYSEGLLKNGGPATDPVKAKLGDERAGEFFRKILFGTQK